MDQLGLHQTRRVGGLRPRVGQPVERRVVQVDDGDVVRPGPRGHQHGDQPAVGGHRHRLDGPGRHVGHWPVVDAAAGQVKRAEPRYSIDVDRDDRDFAAGDQRRLLDVPVGLVEPGDLAVRDRDPGERHEVAVEIGSQHDRVAVGGPTDAEVLARTTDQQSGDRAVQPGDHHADVGVVAEVLHGQRRRVRGPVPGLEEPAGVDQPPDVPGGELAQQHVLVGRLTVVAGVGEPAAVRRHRVGCQVVGRLRRVGELPLVGAVSAYREDLEVLVTVLVGGEEQRRGVGAPRDLPHRPVGALRQRSARSSVPVLDDEVELAPGVGDVGDRRPVGCHRERGPEALGGSKVGVPAHVRRL